MVQGSSLAVLHLYKEIWWGASIHNVTSDFIQVEIISSCRIVTNVLLE